MRWPRDGGGRLVRRSSSLPQFRLPAHREEAATKILMISMPLTPSMSMSMGWRLPGRDSSLLLACTCLLSMAYCIQQQQVADAVCYELKMEEPYELVSSNIAAAASYPAFESRRICLRWHRMAQNGSSWQLSMSGCQVAFEPAVLLARIELNDVTMYLSPWT